MVFIAILAALTYLVLSVLYAIGKLTPTRVSSTIFTLTLAVVTFIAILGKIAQ